MSGLAIVTFVGSVATALASVWLATLSREQSPRQHMLAAIATVVASVVTAVGILAAHREQTIAEVGARHRTDELLRRSKTAEALARELRTAQQRDSAALATQNHEIVTLNKALGERNAEILTLTQRLVQLSGDLSRTMTGGDTFCYVMPYMAWNRTAAVSEPFRVVTAGNTRCMTFTLTSLTVTRFRSAWPTLTLRMSMILSDSAIRLHFTAGRYYCSASSRSSPRLRFADLVRSCRPVTALGTRICSCITSKTDGLSRHACVRRHRHTASCWSKSIPAFPENILTFKENDGRPNFTLKLVRPGFGPAAELPASSPA
jgi:hypothetical protein